MFCLSAASASFLGDWSDCRFRLVWFYLRTYSVELRSIVIWSDRLRWNSYAVNIFPTWLFVFWVCDCFLLWLVFIGFLGLHLSLFSGQEIAVCIRGEVRSHILRFFEIGQVDVLTYYVQ